jgi:hypothetical protein
LANLRLPPHPAAAAASSSGTNLSEKRRYASARPSENEPAREILADHLAVGDPAVILVQLTDDAPNLAIANPLLKGIGHVRTAMPRRRRAALASLGHLKRVDVGEPHHSGADRERYRRRSPGRARSASQARQRPRR